MELIYVLPALAVGYVLFWIVLFHALAHLGGWHAVAKRYSTSVVPEGQRFGMQYCKFGWIDYNGCLTIIVSPQGLYMALWPIFNTGHPALLIPWPALRFVELRKSWLINRALLEVESPPLARIGIPAMAYEAARPYLDSASTSAT